MAKSKQSKEPIPLHSKTRKTAQADIKKKNTRVNAVKRFLNDTRAEFRKIIWPNRHQVTVNTVVVLVTIVIIGAVVMAIDALSITGFNALVK